MKDIRNTIKDFLKDAERQYAQESTGTDESAQAYFAGKVNVLTELLQMIKLQEEES